MRKNLISIVIAITLVTCISLTIMPVKARANTEKSEVTSAEEQYNEDVRKAKEEYVKEYIGSFTDEELDSLIDHIQEDKESDKDKNTKNTENTIGELLWFIGFLVIAAVIFSKFA